MTYCLYVTDPSALTNPDHVAHYSRVGALITSSRNPITPIRGTAVKEVSGLGRKWKWDEATQDIFNTRSDRFLSTADFFSRFTQAEIDSYLDAPQLSGVEKKLNHRATNNIKLDLDSSFVDGILDDMVTRNVINNARKAEILA